MQKRKTNKSTQKKPLQHSTKHLRLWPGIAAALLLLLTRFGLKIIVSGFEGFQLALMGGFFSALVIIVWWIFFSRAPHYERWGALIIMIIGISATWVFRHESMGPFWVAAYAIPLLFLAFVAWAAVANRLTCRLRRITMVVTILIACGIWLLVRTSGIDGDHNAEFAWRWVKSSEERLVVQAGDETSALQGSFGTGTNWPGFRGKNRNSIINGVKIKTDWSESPPVELWRQPIGPGWSSFAVRGNLFYTQEQRGDDEVVSCYSVTTGESVWIHRNKARFFESNAGAGPRGTPTLSNGCIYTFGATGILNALDADDGSVLWSRNAATDTEINTPYWGFSSSPLVIDNVVIVAVASSLIGYDLTTGNPQWSIPIEGDCYSSPHLLNIHGVIQIVLMNKTGVIGVTPNDGKLLWEYPWSGNPIIQPAQTEKGDILITVTERSGIRRIAISNESGKWTIEECWTSTRIKPYFNDFVVHKGHIYGFNGPVLGCIDVNDGNAKWRGKRYGNGQLVLLADQDLLLLISEKGELTLVNAVPDQFTELTHFPAVKGKTWNHPVMVGDVLLVRNGQEMAAFRLPLLDG